MVFHAVSSTISRCNEEAAVPLRDHLNLSLMVFTGIARPLTHCAAARPRVADTPGTHTDDAISQSDLRGRRFHARRGGVAVWLVRHPDRTGAVEGNACHAFRAGIHLRRLCCQLPV